MTSSRPYLIRALYEWIDDNKKTPFILVNSGYFGVKVPKGYDQEGKITLNISTDAIETLLIENTSLSFTAGFKGVRTDVVIPMGAIIGMYAQENGQGMIFEDDFGSLTEAATVPTTTPQSKPPALKIVK